MTVRRHSVADGAGHLSPHYDIMSYEWRPVMPAAISPRESAINATDNNVAVPMELDTTAGSITDADIKMPADDYSLYHCFNYARSNGSSPLTEDYAKRRQRQVYMAIRRDGLYDQAERLLQLGAAGYPRELDFKYFAIVAGFSFVIVQAHMLEPLVYGSELGAVGLTVRRHLTHYDVISYDATLF